MTHYIFADTETTGLSNDAGVVEVAFVVLNEHLGELYRVSSLIDPGVPISPSASGVHGITNEDVIGMPTLDEFMDAHGGWFRVEGAVFLAHNVPFDRRFLGKYLLPDAKSCCTLRLARRFINDAENHKLQTLRYHLGLTGGDAHRALGDVNVTIQLFSWLMGELSATPEELVALSAMPIPVTSMPFGKHRGSPLRDLPASYRHWLLTSAAIDADLRAALESL